MHETPSAERILSLLADLLSEQYGVKATYTIVDSHEETENCEEGA